MISLYRRAIFATAYLVGLLKSLPDDHPERDAIEAGYRAAERIMASEQQKIDDRRTREIQRELSQARTIKKT